MVYKILYKDSVKKDLRSIDKKEMKKIIDAIEKEIAAMPMSGKRLTGEFEGLYALRVGVYRVVYSILKESVLVLKIGHRKDVYR